MALADQTREVLGTWERVCDTYFMRSEQGDGGKLVRLDRVRHWLMAGNDGLPYALAGEALLAPLERLTQAEVATWLFMASDGGHARLVNEVDDFDPPVAWGIDDTHRPAPQDCGVRGALRHARRCWCESPGHGQQWLRQECLDPLAVPVVKAHELWGWGADAAPEAAALDVENLHSFSELVAYRQGPSPELWAVGNQRAILAQEVQARGGKGAQGALTGVAKALGISRQAVGGHLRAHEAAQAASKTASVFNLHKSRQRRA